MATGCGVIFIECLLIYFVLLKVTGDNLRVIYCFVTLADPLLVPIHKNSLSFRSASRIYVESSITEGTPARSELGVGNDD
jgi:hypothetical protein